MLCMADARFQKGALAGPTWKVLHLIISLWAWGARQLQPSGVSPPAQCSDKLAGVGPRLHRRIAGLWGASSKGHCAAVELQLEAGNEVPNVDSRLGRELRQFSLIQAMWVRKSNNV
ncbi:hypothetical protein BS50DRAFT_280755 [Corynespora cassiicola Philippines]|uniref:Uncharacterized protein n=1 Tax=Corynespora cassiicola Philippines TaxID=1448308 RepID=A0A2T2P1X6_CORCC|nr:hypothetical protein BS50DRAFT_280755 [Corynespora cassiicola Philippines]